MEGRKLFDLFATGICLYYFNTYSNLQNPTIRLNKRILSYDIQAYARLKNELIISKERRRAAKQLTTDSREPKEQHYKLHMTSSGSPLGVASISECNICVQKLKYVECEHFYRTLHPKFEKIPLINSMSLSRFFYLIDVLLEA